MKHVAPIKNDMHSMVDMSCLKNRFLLLELRPSTVDKGIICTKAGVRSYLQNFKHHPWDQDRLIDLGSGIRDPYTIYLSPLLSEVVNQNSVFYIAPNPS